MTMSAAKTAPEPAVSGWIDAGLYVLAIGVLSLIYAVSNAWGCHVAAFILYSLLVSAVALLAFTGVGANARAVIGAPQTWIVGLSSISVETAYVLLLSHLPPAEGSLLIRLSIPLSMAIGFAWLGRRPAAWSWIGAALILATIAAVLAALLPMLDPAAATRILAFTAICAIALNLRSFASEFHPQNRAAKTVFDKIQVTGLVTLVTCSATAAAIGIAMALVETGVLPSTPLIPTPVQLLHPPTAVLALVAGGALFTAMTYLSFSAVVKIRTENFIATSAFMPLAAFLVQWPAAYAGLISLPPFSWRLLPALGMVIVGVLLIIWGGRRAQKPSA
jgi:drug/metabolite transporter (DMT)-like permease